MPRLPVTIPQSTPQTSGRIRPPVGAVLTRSTQPLEQTLDRAGNQIQQNTARATAAARSLPFGNGNLIQGVQFTTSATTNVNTSLPGIVRGFWLVNPRSYTGGSPFVTNANPTAPQVGQLALASLGTFVADVYVF